MIGFSNLRVLRRLSAFIVIDVLRFCRKALSHFARCAGRSRMVLTFLPSAAEFLGGAKSLALLFPAPPRMTVSS
jgi:hypothetical protein